MTTPDTPEQVKHTVGPWHVVPYGDGDSLVICSDQGGEWRICFMATHGGTESVWRQIQANARLIAAAPDFADVAPDAAEILDNYAGFIRHSVKADDLDMHPYLPHLEDVIAKLRAALTRTTGGPS